MGKIKKLYIDFDGTIVDSIKAIVSLYNYDFQHFKGFEKIDWEDIKTWDFSECKLVDPKQINTYFCQQRFFDIVEFMDDAKEVLGRLSKEYEIIIVSIGRHPNLRAKEKWIKENLPYAKFIGLNMKYCSDKKSIDMSDGLVIDDVSRFLPDNEKSICFGKEYDWNKDWTGARCENWLEVEDQIKKINGGK